MIILVPDASLAELTPLVSALPVTLVPYTEDGPDPAALPDATVVFRGIAGKRYASLVAAGPKIRWLHTASAGVDHVLTPEIHAKPELLVTDSGPAFGVSIPEFVLTWMLALSHRVPGFLAAQAERRWEWRQQEELFGQTVGIVGLGPIGRGVAQRCRALGMRTLGLRRSAVACPEVDETLVGAEGLTRLLQESDWVVLAAALTGETRTLLGEAELALIKPTAHLINIARGPLIDEAALTTALQNHRIAGAVLDVFVKEPLPSDSALWTMPNVYVTSHSSGWTPGLRTRQTAFFVENLRRFLNGEALESIVDLQRGY